MDLKWWIIVQQVNVYEIILFFNINRHAPEKGRYSGGSAWKSDLEAVDRPLRRSLFSSFSVSLIVGHAVARRHEHRRISFCARGIIMAEEEAKPSALAHVGRTLNDELDTARVREKEEEEGCARARAAEGKERERKTWACSLTNAYPFLSRLFHPRRNKWCP